MPDEETVTAAGYPRPDDPVDRLDDLLAALAPTLRTAMRVGIAIELRSWVAALRAEAGPVPESSGDPAEEREQTLRDVADLIALRAAALEDPKPLRLPIAVPEADFAEFMREWTNVAARAIWPVGDRSTSEVLAGPRPHPPRLFVAAQTPAQAMDYAMAQRLASHSWSPMCGIRDLRGYSDVRIWFTPGWSRRWSGALVNRLLAYERRDGEDPFPGSWVRVQDPDLDPWRAAP